MGTVSLVAGALLPWEFHFSWRRCGGRKRGPCGLIGVELSPIHKPHHLYLVLHPSLHRLREMASRLGWLPIRWSPRSEPWWSIETMANPSQISRKMLRESAQSAAGTMQQRARLTCCHTAFGRIALSWGHFSSIVLLTADASNH